MGLSCAVSAARHVGFADYRPKYVHPYVYIYDVIQAQLQIKCHWQFIRWHDLLYLAISKLETIEHFVYVLHVCLKN